MDNEFLQTIVALLPFVILLLGFLVLALSQQMVDFDEK